MLENTSTQKDNKRLRFLKSWFEKPLITGSVTPSSRYLAQKMVSYIDKSLNGPVIELGPGTGPVTDALLKHGIAEDQIIMLEYNKNFVEDLRRRYPKATVIQGDAYELSATLEKLNIEKAIGTISSLPLFTKPLPMRLQLLQESFDAMQPDCPFVQFTYAVVPPIPKDLTAVKAVPSNKVWKNIPPARVWSYYKQSTLN